MECKNHNCKYHNSRPMVISLTCGKIGLVQGCKFGYCKLMADKNMKKKRGK